MVKIIISIIIIAGFNVSAYSQLINIAASLPATDALGRKLPSFEEVGDVKKDKYVGIFYWTWHYAQAGYKPNNTTEFLKLYPQAAYDFNNAVWPKNIMNFWSEPLFGYYVNTDKWVLYRHAEMLADAGVDMIMFDCTNGDFVWKPAYMKLCEVFTEARKNGIRTPQIAFMMGFAATEASKSAINQVYNDLYKPGLYKDLWFKWKGKPLIMAYPDNIDTEIKDFFSFRPGQPVYDKGPERKDHWGWLEIYPQHSFVKNETGGYEQITVSTSQNWTKMRGLSAMNTPGAFGRSYTNKAGQDSRADAHQYGLNFQEQWDYALKQDVELVFVTGWNEWIAGRFKKWQGQQNAFPDQFDVEHSRDIEPMKGGHQDNYYYQLISNIRRFKGMSSPPLFSGSTSIKIDGNFEEWDKVLPKYLSHRGNTLHRDAAGFSGTHYINNTGRNDVVTARIAQDKKNIYFFVETAGNLTPANDNKWMRLFIDIDRNKKTGWEGYDFVINRKSPGKKAFLERSLAKWEWNAVGEISFSYVGNRIELSVPRSMLSIKGKIDLEFKWSDNMQKEGDIMDFVVNGDVAPSGRFNYYYTEK